MDEKVTSTKQNVTSIKQKVMSKEQKLTRNEQKVMSNEPRATSKKFSLFFKKGAGLKTCFPVNIAKFLRTSILKNICEQLLLLTAFYHATYALWSESTLYLPECQGITWSKWARYLKIKRLQKDSNPQPLSL